MADLGIKTFQQEYKRLLKIVGAEKDFSSQQAARALIRAQLSASIGMLPKMEQSVQKYGGRAAYAWTTINDHIRALTHDLRGFGDNSSLVEKVRRDAVQVSLRVLMTEIISRAAETRRELNTRLPDKQAAFADRLMRNFQESLEDMFVKAERDSHALVERALSVK